ncbi:uncharacterized protein LOC128861002 [Anastrepha ludens]|uniref:uncharacterized protein LOC128861002 n=1 Tax=Anastrepha ludens TaxID=28586 RepID=UPI0023B16762|nr:uncharacterized protein LOC128861002 [Anastrepha ludens]
MSCSCINPIPVQYVRSRRGTHLVLYKYNTYTPNEKVRDGRLSRDWKCSMYHKAKCRARLVTRQTLSGDVIHITSDKHTHKPMYTSAEVESMQKQNLMQQQHGLKDLKATQTMEQCRPIRTFQYLNQLQQLQLRPLYPQPMPTVSLLETQFPKMLPRQLS